MHPSHVMAVGYFMMSTFTQLPNEVRSRKCMCFEFYLHFPHANRSLWIFGDSSDGNVQLTYLQKLPKLDNYQRKLSTFFSMNIMPNEYEKDCDKDASNSLTAETGQTNTSFRPSNEEHRLSQKTFASYFQFQWWAHSLVLYTLLAFLGFSRFRKKLWARLVGKSTKCINLK